MAFFDRHGRELTPKGVERGADRLLDPPGVFSGEEEDTPMLEFDPGPDYDEEPNDYLLKD